MLRPKDIGLGKDSASYISPLEISKKEKFSLRPTTTLRIFLRLNKARVGVGVGVGVRSRKVNGLRKVKLVIFRPKSSKVSL